MENAIHLLAASLNDGHVSYDPGCYQSVIFRQPISLYAPVIDGKQEIRVFKTTANASGLPAHDLTDCVVSYIDGEPALKAIQDFTDLYSGISKDPSVRLVDALSTTIWSNSDWGTTSGGFSVRVDVPAKNEVQYIIQCPKSRVQKLVVPWAAQPRFGPTSFSDSKSYWKNLCIAPVVATKKNKNGDNKLHAGSVVPVVRSLPPLPRPSSSVDSRRSLLLMVTTQ